MGITMAVFKGVKVKNNSNYCFLKSTIVYIYQVTGVAYSGNSGPAGSGVPLMGSGSAAAAAAPLSLPSQASRRFGIQYDRTK